MSVDQRTAVKDKVLKSILGEEDEKIAHKAFEAFGAFMNATIGDAPLNHEIFITLSLLSMYHQSLPPCLPAPPPTPFCYLPEELSEDRAELSLRFARFATAAYGSDLLERQGLLKGFRPEMLQLLRVKQVEKRYIAERAAIAYHVGPPLDPIV